MPDRPSYDELAQRLQALEAQSQKARPSEQMLGHREAHYRLLFENLTSGFALRESCEELAEIFSICTPF
jgi:hypothetical protein